ncbi:MAG: cytidylate kinase family protein [Candidatus Micrarchaeota archaeon]|nr:cytidylate kinase family protein [Candidatus Micrarchaeota archaeon]
MKICISGMTASGKTALGHMLAKELNVEHITKFTLESFHKATEDAKSKKGSHLDVVQAISGRKFAKRFDDELVELARSRKDFVVTIWLGPWLIEDATLRVWLNAPIDERAKRRAKDMKITIKEAKEMIEEKDRQNIRLFKEIQGVDITDHSIFDMELNTSKLSLSQMVSLISMLALSKEKKIFA